MTRDTRGIILGLVASLLLRLSLTGDFQLYVKQSMRPWLIVSGVLLAALSVVDVMGFLRPPGDDHHDASLPADAHHHDGHRHAVLPWLLITPSIVVFAIGPAPLGSFMAERQPSSARVAPDNAATADSTDVTVADSYGFPPLPPAVDGAVPIHIAEFVSRAGFEPERRMDGVLIRLEGLVTPDPDGPGGTFLLTKFVISCCAADGRPVSVRARGLDPIPPTDTWLRVEGYWRPHPKGAQPPPYDDFEIVSSQTIPAPANPYG